MSDSAHIPQTDASAGHTLAADPTLMVVHDGAAAPAGQAQGYNASFFVMLALIFGVFYFLLIRPQAKEQKAHQSLLASLQAGDRVVTASGLHGKVHLVKDSEVILEVADKVRITVDKPSIKRRRDAGSDKEKK